MDTSRLPPALVVGAHYDTFLQRALRHFFERATLESESIPSPSSDGRLAIEPTADPGRRVVVVTVEEADRQEVYVEPGYGSYEGPRARTGYRRRNLLGTALSWNTEAAGSLKYQGAASTLSDPSFLGADLKADKAACAARSDNAKDVCLAEAAAHQRAVSRR